VRARATYAMPTAQRRDAGDAMKLIFCKAAADIKAGQELVVDEAGNARPVTGYDLRFHPMFTEAQRKGKQDVKGQTDTDEDTDF